MMSLAGRLMCVCVCISAFGKGIGSGRIGFREGPNMWEFECWLMWCCHASRQLLSVFDIWDSNSRT